ncbi:MAG TPA: YbhB/YbcL family Raf kinase inhibitor-like protein [Polyangiaceae bacterium]|nr:YbhB/YbcL family Raf kinase inhibitor-like protein [Polyangiaceae bacterium]
MASRLAWGILVLGATTLAACSSSDDDSGSSGGSSGSGGSGATGGSSSAGAPASGGAAGMACVGDPPITDHHTCSELPSVNKGDSGFMISSPDFANCDPIPTADTCDGNAFGTGMSPKLTWTGVPAGTKSFALTFKDIAILADNATDPHGFHWVMWNIPATTTEIDGGMTGPGSDYHSSAVPGALQWSNLAYGFFPPCPNPFPRDNAMFTCMLSNDIYSFTLYALPTETIDPPAPTLDPTTMMPTGNYVVNMATYIDTLPAIAVTEYRGTSHAWATSFTPPSGAKYPCTQDMITGMMTDGCLQ